jgi:hypothetical protein
MRILIIRPGCYQVTHFPSVKYRFSLPGRDFGSVGKAWTYQAALRRRPIGAKVPFHNVK